MISLARRRYVFQAPNPNIQAPEKLQITITNYSSAADWILRLEVSLDVVSLEFGIYEIVLARKTGTILLLVVGLHHRRPDQLDRRAQLRRKK
jgi:hypothetical protein